MKTSLTLEQVKQNGMHDSDAAAMPHFMRLAVQENGYEYIPGIADDFFITNEQGKQLKQLQEQVIELKYQIEEGEATKEDLIEVRKQIKEIINNRITLEQAFDIVSKA